MQLPPILGHWEHAPFHQVGMRKGGFLPPLPPCNVSTSDVPGELSSFPLLFSRSLVHVRGLPDTTAALFSMFSTVLPV